MAKSDWIWMPHPGHFICSRDCRFHFNTYVNGHIVSTVGELLPGERVREIYASSRGIVLQGRGYEREADFLQKHGWVEIGHGRKYETMVFKAKKSTAGCCAWEMASSGELDFAGYNDAKAAVAGHMAMCRKWDGKR